MKKLLKFSVIFLLIGLALTGCYKEPIIENPNVEKTFNYDPNSMDWELAKRCALYSVLAYPESRIMKNGSNQPSKAEFNDLLSHYTTKDIQYYYDGKDNFVDDKNLPVVLQAHLKWEGFKEIDSKNYGNSIVDDISYTLAYKEVNDGEILLVVILRGTDGVEWFGNMDIWGEDGSKKGDRHFSFENANKELQNDIKKYISANDDLKNKPINLLITGHSRGAAVANLFAVDTNTKTWCSEINIKNVYAYTFATPNNTKGKTEYNNIFNFCFE